MGQPDPTPTDAPRIISPEAVELIAAGAAPVDVDVNALMAQMQALQARVDAMTAAQGIPTDPIAAAVKNVRDHVTARVNMQGGARKDELAELVKAVADLSDAPSKDEAELLRILLDETRAFEGQEYCKELARNLHKQLIKTG